MKLYAFITTMLPIVMHHSLSIMIMIRFTQCIFILKGDCVRDGQNRALFLISFEMFPFSISLSFTVLPSVAMHIYVAKNDENVTETFSILSQHFSRIIVNILYFASNKLCRILT